MAVAAGDFKNTLDMGTQESLYPVRLLACSKSLAEGLFLLPPLRMPNEINVAAVDAADMKIFRSIKKVCAMDTAQTFLKKF